jgi:cytochrome bd-type quinol oxidase subunit 2
LNRFAEWLANTSASNAFRLHESWLIPGIQSIHIIGIAIIMGSVLLIVLRILGWAGTDQTLRQTTDRFGPWLIGALCLQLVTGIVMIIAEPARELVNFSFWTKMVFTAVGTVLSSISIFTLRNHEQQWETLINRRSIKSLAVLTFLIFLCIIVLGRLIAYDHIWGSWSPATSEY